MNVFSNCFYFVHRFGLVFVRNSLSIKNKNRVEFLVEVMTCLSGLHRNNTFLFLCLKRSLQLRSRTPFSGAIGPRFLGPSFSLLMVFLCHQRCAHAFYWHIYIHKASFLKVHINQDPFTTQSIDHRDEFLKDHFECDLSCEIANDSIQSR